MYVNDYQSVLWTVIEGPKIQTYYEILSLNVGQLSHEIFETMRY